MPARARPDKRRPKARQIFFLHIPKAAGTSFIECLLQRFPAAKVLVNGYWESIRKQPISDLQRYRVVTGHIGYDLAFHLKDPFVITLLRDPVEKFVSTYEYLKWFFENYPASKHPDPDVQKITAAWKALVRLPFEAVLESPDPIVRAALLENPQARQLAQATPYLLTDLSTRSLREISLQRLQAIDVVGTSGHFAATVRLVHDKLGWAMPAESSEFRGNVTPATARTERGSIGTSLRRRIESLCEVDAELHEAAHKRLLSEVGQSRRTG
jgi:hypothetical protein